MKKTRVFFFTVMLMLVALTGTVMGATESKNVRGQIYTYQKTGTRIIFTAASAVKTCCYSTVFNKTNTTLNCAASVREYVYDEGWRPEWRTRSNISSGLIVSSPVYPRYADSYTRYFLHFGGCYVSPTATSPFESYSFKANQYY